jgi:hypothetical protein
MPFRDKLIIALTVLLLPASPFIALIIMEVGMNVYVEIVMATADPSAEIIECGVGPPWFLPLIGFGPVVMAQIWMVILSVGIIREHKRRKRLA